MIYISCMYYPVLVEQCHASIIPIYVAWPEPLNTETVDFQQNAPTIVPKGKNGFESKPVKTQDPNPIQFP